MSVLPKPALLHHDSRVRYFYAAFGLMSLFIAITSVISVIYLKRDALEKIERTSQELARSLDLSLSGQLDAVDLALTYAAREIGQQYGQKRPDPVAMTRFLVEQKSQLPNVSYIRASDEHGNVVFGPDVQTPSTNLVDLGRDYFIRLRDDPQAGLFIEKPFFGRIAQKWVWTFARRINKPDGSFGGVVFAAILTNQIDELLAKVALDKGDSVRLRGRDLALIASFPPPAQTKTSIGDTGISNAFGQALVVDPIAGTYISGATSIDGISRIHSYKHNEKYGYTINVGFNEELTLQGWRTQARFVSVLVTTFLFSLLGLTVLIHKAWQGETQQLLALKESQQRLNEAQYIAHLGSWHLDVASNQVVWSIELYRMYGFDPTLPPPPYTEHQKLFAPDSWEQLNTALENTRVTGIPYELELKTVRADGANGWMWVRGERLSDENNVIVGLRGVAQDITERKAAEAELSAAYHQLQENQAKMLQIEKLSALGTLVGGVAHEINNPLMGAMNCISAVSRRSSDAKILEILAEATVAMQRIATIVRNMLVFVRTDSRASGSCKLPNVLEQAWDTLRPRLQHSGVEKIVHLPDELPPLECSEDSLRQILINLLSNSCDAVQDCQQRLIEISAHRHDNTIEITVADTGSGIPGQLMGKIFDPFLTTKPPGKGTGLGLYVSRQLVEAAGGTISAANRPSGGACFTVRFSVGK